MCEVAPRTARHAPPSRAWRRTPPPRMTGPLTSRLPGTPRLPASREGVHRRTTAIALVLVLVFTSRTCLLLLPRFTTPLSTTCGCASGQQRVPQRTVVKREPIGHHIAWTYTIGAGDAAIGTGFAARGPAAADVVASLPRLPLLRPISPPPRCTRGSSNVIDPGRTMCTFLLPRWQVHLRAGSSRSTDCRPGRFTFGHRIWELGF